jgi:hypothetical protein
LKLALDALGVPITPETFSDRLLLQKATYLVQAAGVQLGYRYSWYLKGPYSPELTRDYFRLTADTTIARGYQIRDDLQQAVERVAQNSHPPDGSGLSRPEWLELLASLHYLMRRLGKSPDEAAEVIHLSKPRLYAHVAAGREALLAAGLL